MMTDQTYTPMHNDFQAFMGGNFPNITDPDQVRLMRSIFFAGAAASYQVLTKSPDRKATLLAELVDHTEQLEARERV